MIIGIIQGNRTGQREPYAIFKVENGAIVHIIADDVFA